MKYNFPFSFMFKKSIVSISWVILLLTPLLVSCAKPPASADAIHFGLASAPITLDPRYSTDAISSRINRLLYRQLIDFDDASQPIPSLATWDKLTEIHFRFHLREQYRTFHDGSRLTASDVKATYNSVLQKSSASPHRSTLHMIKQIEVVDENTLDIFLNQPDPLFPGYLEIGILPKEKILANHPFNTSPIGSGPFRFVAWPNKNKLELRRIRDNQLVQFLHVRDENTRVLKLIRGELDMLQNDIDSELIKYLREQPAVTVTSAPGRNFSYIGFNLQDEIVGQHAIREAIAYAIDRPSIVRHLFSGRARLANTLLTADHWAGHPGLGQYSYAPDRARELLKALGYDESNPLELVYKTSTNPFRIRLATVIQHQLAAVGIDVQLRTYDWGTFYADIKAGNFQMYSLAWVGINLPDIFRHVFHSDSIPPAGANRGRYRNHEVDELLTRAQLEANRKLQARVYRKVQEILFKQLPYVPLWYEDHIFIARKSMKGYVIHADGNYDGLQYVERTT